MEALGRILVIAGGVIIVAGLAIWGLGKAGFKGLPGDIRYEGENFRLYFPIVSCIVLSVLLTLIFWIINWFRSK